MEAEIVRGWRANIDYGRRHVPFVARKASNRRVVSKHGHARLNRIIFRHGHFPTHPILRHGIHC